LFIFLKHAIPLELIEESSVKVYKINILERKIEGNMKFF